MFFVFFFTLRKDKVFVCWLTYDEEETGAESVIFLSQICKMDKYETTLWKERVLAE